MSTATISQNTRIFNHLAAHPGRWVGMPELVKLSGSYNVHSRVSDLRKRGVSIECRVDRTKRKAMSFYRIKEGAL